MALEKTDGYASGTQFAKEVIASLQNAGVSLAKPVALSFYLYLPTRKAARACQPLLESEGLEVKIDKSGANDGQWLCLCHRTFKPTQKPLAKLADLFLDLAEKHGGQFDGWETNPYTSQEGLAGLLEEILKQFAAPARS